MSDIFKQREAAFEADYFNRKERETIDKLKKVFHHQTSAEGISQATGVKDPKVLQRMVELNLKGELMSAFQLYPVVEVAWADGTVDEAEAKVILAAAEARGITPGTEAYGYLQERLKAGPSDDLRTIWMSYAEQLRGVLDAKELASFRQDILDLCLAVAQASGGVLGKLFTVDSSEKRMLEKITASLTS